MFDWKEPRLPDGSSTRRIDGWTFDRHMVDFEQRMVQDLIVKLAPGNLVKKELAIIDNNCWVASAASFALRGASVSWVKERFGTVDFFNEEHRRAIGYSLITVFHKRTKKDFLALTHGMD